MILVSVYDTKADTWSRPVVADSKASAMRDFATLVRNKDTLPGQHPEDFQLFNLLEFRSFGSDGYQFEKLLPSPEHLANGVDYAQVQSPKVEV